MTTQHDKPKRWRPRFSVRTLVILVTLTVLPIKWFYRVVAH
jgi:hypothetical protein